MSPKLESALRGALIAVSAAVATAAVTLPAFAHHSFAMFDFSKSITMKGTVKEFEWKNPHVVLWVTGEPRAGAAPEVWSLELTSPGNLTRGGWTKRSFPPGEQVQVEFAPLRNGTKGGAFRKGAILATGKVYTSSLQQQNGKAGLD